jgi:2-oxoisovalerate dehydrogenase E1 component
MADDQEARLGRHFVDAARALKEHEPVAAGDRAAPVRPGSGLTGAACLDLFDAQAGSRQLDFAGRWLQAQGVGFYTVGSAGHESNAAIAAALRPDDPALLHYRSGAFYLARAAQLPGVTDPVRDVLLGVAAAATEPISGGRHKVFGHAGLNIIPQTSTIGSHLPRAVGVAFAIDRSRKLDTQIRWRPDAIAVCSFGDATVNHATALAGLNAAAYSSAQGIPIPVLFVCEDNGLGISVRTPSDWIRATWSDRPGIRYFATDGADLARTFDSARTAVEFVRRRRRPAFLHLRTVRFLGHAGSDVEAAYRSPAEVSADLAADPLVGTARLLVEAGVCTPHEVIERYESAAERVFAVARDVLREPRLGTAGQVMEPFAAPDDAAVAERSARAGSSSHRRAVFAGGSHAEPRLPETEGPLTLAGAINRSLADVMASRPGVLVFGEDVGRKGGVYGVTRGLQQRFGSARVFDTLLDETSILGLALGCGVSGLLPIPEIQYLAYLHNAEDQLRGEAATLRFFSQGQYANPMIVRVPGYAYQRGFGGHFHNDNALGVLRDIPGLIIASPARPDDAAAMLRTCLAAAEITGSVCVFLEPIALYHIRDLYEDGDGGWLAAYSPPARWADAHVPVGRARTYGAGGDLTIVAFGNGVRMSLRVARSLAIRHGIGCRVVDLRWLAPLPVEDMLREAMATGRVLVADETRRSGGVSEGVVTALVDADFGGLVARVTSEDSLIPLGPAASLVLLAEPAIEAAAMRLLGL